MSYFFSQSGFCKFLRCVGGPVSLLVCIMLCLAGCDSSSSRWGPASRSPDGQWIVNIRTDEFGGPGNNALFTHVYMAPVRHPYTPTEILLFDGEKAVTARLRYEVRWLSTTHLEVAYTEDLTLDFQAIKMANIEISVRHLAK